MTTDTKRRFEDENEWVGEGVAWATLTFAYIITASPTPSHPSDVLHGILFLPYSHPRICNVKTKSVGHERVRVKDTETSDRTDRVVFRVIMETRWNDNKLSESEPFAAESAR